MADEADGRAMALQMGLAQGVMDAGFKEFKEFEEFKGYENRERRFFAPGSAPWEEVIVILANPNPQ